jgi:hypothetical protein
MIGAKDLGQLSPSTLRPRRRVLGTTLHRGYGAIVIELSRKIRRNDMPCVTMPSRFIDGLSAKALKLPQAVTSEPPRRS